MDFSVSIVHHWYSLLRVNAYVAPSALNTNLVQFPKSYSVQKSNSMSDDCDRMLKQFLSESAFHLQNVNALAVQFTDNSWVFVGVVCLLDGRGCVYACRFSCVVFFGDHCIFCSCQSISCEK